MEIKGDHVLFSTGRILYSYRGIIGLGPKDQYASAYSWDMGFEPKQHNNRDDHLIKDERIELANYMINLWTKYKEKD